MAKKLPARAASRKQFIFWQIVAFMFCFFGTLTMVQGDGLIGLVLFVGGFGMSLREISLRKKWKDSQTKPA